MELFIFLLIIAAIIIGVATSKKKKNKKRGKQQSHDSYTTTKGVTHGLSSGYNHTFTATKTTFYGKDSTAHIKGLTLTSPMIYFSENHSRDALPHVIYGKYKVEFSGVEESLGYWPGYSSISACSRGRLLKWLEDGKSDPNVDIGLVFIYFYGLEFRAIGEGKDWREILQEVIRLYNIYSFNNSFRRYAESFIAYLILKIKEFSAEEERSLLDFITRLAPYSSLYQSGAHLKLEKGHISDENLFRAVAAYENTPRSRIPEKVGTVFKDYFLLQSQTLMAKVREEAQLVVANYSHYCATPLYNLNSASQVEGCYLKISKTIMNRLAKLWKECIEELKPYSRKMGTASEEELFLLLPEKMRTESSHPLLESFSKFGKKRGDSACKVGEIAEQLNQEYKERITLKNSKAICSTLQELGFGVEPDARYSGKSYKWDDTVVFYPVEVLELPKTAGFATASLLFDLGVYISSADGTIDKEELDTVVTFVKDNFCSNAQEAQRIEKRRKLAEAGVIKATGIAKKLADKLKVGELKKVGNYLFMVAAADGVIDRSEIKVIKKIFNDFGLGEEHFNTILNDYKGSHQVDEKTSGSQLPPPLPAEKEERITIDQESLKAILADTEQVKEILNNVFNNEEEDNMEEELPSLQTIEKTEHNLSLPPELESFMQHILTKDNWQREELHKMALEKKIMLDSAVEEINFWCEEQTGDYLIYEEGGKFTVQGDLLGQD